MAAYSFITFLTDYGLEDGFVAACHGVAARISPATRVIDVTHLVPPGDVRRGAAVLAQTIPYLPAGVHVAVVDPGVGTVRRAVAVAVDVEAGERIFVGPDNGVLSWAVHGFGGPVRAYELTNPDLWLEPVSPTFHGRDVFMPVAARVAAGLELSQVGRSIDPAELFSLPLPVRRIRDGAAEGEVLTIDRFGNVQLSLTVLDLDRLGIHVGSPLTLTLGRRRLHVPYRDTFGSVPPGELVAYVDSAGCVSLAVNSGNAARRLTLPAGSHVHISPAVVDPKLTK